MGHVCARLSVRSRLAVAAGVLCLTTLAVRPGWPDLAQAQAQARANATEAQKAFVAGKKLITGWWAERDTDTALLPENLRSAAVRRWTPSNSGADNWPFMVIAARFVDPAFYGKECLETLADEQRLTNRVRRLADDFDLRTHRFVHPQPDRQRIIFGSAEYAKDGLLSISELFGPGTPYFARLRDLTDDLLAESKVETRFGPIPAADHEVNGDMLQVLARLWWVTRDERYLDMGARIAQHFLLDEPPAKADKLRLRDHGGEIVNGLCEFYVAAKTGRPALASKLRVPLVANLDRILEIGANPDGLLYNEVNAATGEVRDKGLADTWGYILDGYYTLYRLEGIPRYRDAVRKALGNLGKYRDYDWESGSMDGLADALESAVTLLRWEPTGEGFIWCSHTFDKMLAIQQPSGIFEGWHGDGNAIRSALMWAFCLSQGAWVEPWREDVRTGAAHAENQLVVCVAAASDWKGLLRFDRPRHKDYWKMAADYPRINGFSEWFTAEAGQRYQVRIGASAPAREVSGNELINGIALNAAAGEPVYVLVSAAGGEPPRVTAPAAAPAPPVLSEKQKIAALLNVIEKAKDATFIRNDSEYPSWAARQLMDTKLERAGKGIKTAGDFIDQVGTKSNTSGRPYLLRLADGRTTESAFWLRARLREIEQGAR